MGKVMMGGIVPLLGLPMIYDPVFANNTWTEIIEACQTNRVPGEWKAGDQKPMTIDNTEYLIDIIGKNHDDYADGSGKAPLTFQMHDCYSSPFTMNDDNTNKTGWSSCYMRLDRMPFVLARMPDAVQGAVREVTKLTTAGNKDSAISTTADKLFLLSEAEILGSDLYSFSGEGAQYEYYKSGNKRIKVGDEKTQSWWTRSPVSNETTTFCEVGTTGNFSNETAGDSSTYISVAFCF